MQLNLLLRAIFVSVLRILREIYSCFVRFVFNNQFPMRPTILSFSLILLLSILSPRSAAAQQEQDLTRAMSLLDETIARCFTGSTMRMYDLYDTATHQGSGTADVWPYTAAIEATCSVLEALDILRDKCPEQYADGHDRYVALLRRLFDNLAYYRGSYQLNSYAYRARWSIYGVHRANGKGGATVTGIENVYDDQMWLARELVRAYRLTADADYLREATMLTDYVLDGWDCCLDAQGNEYGGISWGPGYNSKHSCSNAPIIQPLVWLHDIYSEEGRADTYVRHFIDREGNRTEETLDRADAYLTFARKIYAWQKEHLLNPSTGVYYDMLGADNTIRYDTVVSGRAKLVYRRHVDTGKPGGTAFTYNTGTMLAGTVELYRATGQEAYAADIRPLCVKSLTAFTKWRRLDGNRYREFPLDAKATSGFNCWFNDVLMRAYVDAYAYEPTNAATALDAFQFNLDYAWDHYLADGFLPIDLLGGWNDDSVTKGFHQLAFASEYALLAVWKERQSQAAAVEPPFVDSAVPEPLYTLGGQRIPNAPTTGIYLQGPRKILVK